MLIKHCLLSIAYKALLKVKCAWFKNQCHYKTHNGKTHIEIIIPAKDTKSEQIYKTHKTQPSSWKPAYESLKPNDDEGENIENWCLYCQSVWSIWYGRNLLNWCDVPAFTFVVCLPLVHLLSFVLSDISNEDGKALRASYRALIVKEEVNSQTTINIVQMFLIGASF